MAKDVGRSDSKGLLDCENGKMHRFVCIKKQEAALLPAYSIRLTTELQLPVRLQSQVGFDNFLQRI